MGGNEVVLQFSADSADELRPLIQAVVAECLARLPVADDRICYSEQEAAALLGVSKTTLRDERLRGRVFASLVGRKIRYTREQLLSYLESRPWEPTDYSF